MVNKCLIYSALNKDKKSRQFGTIVCFIKLESGFNKFGSVDFAFLIPVFYNINTGREIGHIPFKLFA
jgi:hypothetical protein